MPRGTSNSIQGQDSQYRQARPSATRPAESVEVRRTMQVNCGQDADPLKVPPGPEKNVEIEDGLSESSRPI
ncbi:hypothetical protein NDU88_005127 [Pleurodeles waltl]|uniref:Uncharacterized protein n=1 Tax=Pleurodeles waltl TaxID=8319 RepID=A0AAV7NLK0_PLEWA|nr:hypothetical protein NDU88_005127 [Pleurodeles waltl]